MPPKPKFTKEQLINTAFDIAKEEGFSAITIRRVATKLNCSIAPIYVNFKDVEELKLSVVDRIMELNYQLIAEQTSGEPFLDLGIASVIFAKQYPLLFDELGLKDNSLYQNHAKANTFALDQMKKDPKLAQFNDTERHLLLIKMKAFQGGLSLLARKSEYADVLTDDMIVQLLKDTGSDIIQGMKQRKGV